MRLTKELLNDRLIDAISDIVCTELECNADEGYKNDSIDALLTLARIEGYIDMRNKLLSDIKMEDLTMEGVFLKKC